MQKTQNTQSVYRKQKNAVLISHRMGPNNLAVKWWRDQGDKADG